MLRGRLAQSWLSGEEGFFWRGQEVLRIEGFSDAVFAFAVAFLAMMKRQSPVREHTAIARCAGRSPNSELGGT